MTEDYLPLSLPQESQSRSCSLADSATWLMFCQLWGEQSSSRQAFSYCTTCTTAVHRLRNYAPRPSALSTLAHILLANKPTPVNPPSPPGYPPSPPLLPPTPPVTPPIFPTSTHPFIHPLQSIYPIIDSPPSCPSCHPPTYPPI